MQAVSFLHQAKPLLNNPAMRQRGFLMLSSRAKQSEANRWILPDGSVLCVPDRGSAYALSPDPVWSSLGARLLRLFKV